MRKNVTEHEPKKVIQALTDPSWIEAMQDELLQFKLQKVWTLVDLPHGKRAIGTKWVYRNKKDDRGIVVRNKARLVAQGYTQEEGIDYDKVFAPVARMKHSEKALYGLHQAPKAWYETLSTYLLENRFRRGTIDKTLFIKKDKGDILLVQMSSMGELTFFLGLQVKQKDDGFFVAKVKCVADILKSLFLPLEDNKNLIVTNRHCLRMKKAPNKKMRMWIGACARFQVYSKVSHLHAEKMIFRILKGQPKLAFGILGFHLILEAVSDSGLTLELSLTGNPQTGVYETVYKEWEDRMERAATTASSLEAE
ncbi:putative ribonuclease H-like domain-containing protein [Tanacetum coccineum]|uniref:Ribonuclease H-like domain-containing protein n=1 Tax=Tanacetum coccineum TaxID=301880 RepID=A0ABQ4ZLB8_9ASTR